MPYAAIVVAPTIASASTLQAVESLGISLAQKLLDAGAAQILTAAKQQTAEEIIRQKTAKQISANTNSAASS